MKYVSVKDICDIKTGKYDANHAKENGKYKFFTCALCPIQADTYSFKGKLVMLPGNGANLGEVMYYEGKIEAYQRTYVLHNIKINAKFLFYYLKLNWKRYILRRQIGSATNYMKLDDILNFEIPNIDLDTQCKIVEILDKAQNLIDKRKEQIRTLDELIKSQFIEMFGEPVLNTKHWEVKPVIDMCDCMVPGRDKPKSFTGATPWITIEDLKVNGTTFKSKSNLGLTDDEINEVKRKKVPKGSVLMSCVGNLGICSIAGEEMIINQQLHSFQCKSINNVFLMYYLGFRKDYMVSQASSTTILYMNKTACNSIPVYLPPIELQNQFSDFVKQVDKLKFKMEKSLKSLEDNFNSLMQRAFKGELFN